MGMAAGGKGAQSDINVTPLVDIVLVLLIIFMVITPMLSKQLPIEVPQKAEIEKPPEEVKEQLFIKLFDDGHVELNKEELELDALASALESKLAGRSSKVVFFDGEDNAPYGNAVAVMDLAKGAGAETIGMVTPKDKPIDFTGSGAAGDEGAGDEGEAPAAPE